MLLYRAEEAAFVLMGLSALLVGPGVVGKICDERLAGFEAA